MFILMLQMIQNIQGTSTEVNRLTPHHWLADTPVC